MLPHARVQPSPRLIEDAPFLVPRTVADLVKAHAGGRHKGVHSRQLVLIVPRDAGVGNSRVLNELRAQVQGVQVTALTARAACGVGGVTLHRLLKLPVRITEDVSALPPNVAEETAMQLDGMRYLVIDEYNIVGQRLLGAIHTRLCQLRRNSLPFGGLWGVLLMGDPRNQRAPVMDHSLLVDHPGALMPENQENGDLAEQATEGAVDGIQ